MVLIVQLCRNQLTVLLGRCNHLIISLGGCGGKQALWREASILNSADLQTPLSVCTKLMVGSYVGT